MTELLAFILEKIAGRSDFVIEEKKDEGRVVLDVKADPEVIGLIIGKQGKNIKNIRRILSVRAAKEGVAVDVLVNEAS